MIVLINNDYSFNDSKKSFELIYFINFLIHRGVFWSFFLNLVFFKLFFLLFLLIFFSFYCLFNDFVFVFWPWGALVLFKLFHFCRSRSNVIGLYITLSVELCSPNLCEYPQLISPSFFFSILSFPSMDLISLSLPPPLPLFF